MQNSDQGKKLQSLKDKVDRLEKELRGLKDLLNVQDNWHSEVRNWIGEWVTVQFEGKLQAGVLSWVDRYTLCVDVEDGGLVDGEKMVRKTIFPKSQIALSIGR